MTTINIFHGNSISAMQSMKDNQYDLAIVDPPYGIGMDGGNVGYKGYNNFKQKDWDKEPTPPEYFDFLIMKSKNQVIWGANHYIDNFPFMCNSSCWIVWDKGEGFKNRTYAEGELAWTSFNRNVKIFKRDPLAKGDYKGKIHPTAKPIPLYKWLLKNYAKPGDKIFDSHGGSMSHAIACIDMGFDLDIYELDKDYYDSAVKRIKNYVAQTDLSRPPVQINYITL